MHSTEAHWEDEENNRRVAFTVGYTRCGDSVEITALTPKQVTFVCAEKKQPVRTIGVWTEKGRDLLVRQLNESGHVAQVKQQVETSLAV